jgi:hypothetical protein
VTNGTENLGAKLLTLSSGTSASSLNMEAALGSYWPPIACPALLALTVTDHAAVTSGATCMELDGASGGGSWYVTIDPYTVTMELDSAQQMLTINGSQTVSNINNGGGTCTVTLTATATRI